MLHWPALQTHEQLRHDMSCGSSTESTDLACAVGRALTVLGRYPLILTVHFFIFLLSVHCVSVKGEVLSKPLEFISNLCPGLQQLRYHSMTLPSLTVHSNEVVPNHRVLGLYVVNPRCACRRVTVVGYVCVCVCPVRFFQTVMNRPRRPTDRLSAAIA